MFENELLLGVHSQYFVHEPSCFDRNRVRDEVPGENDLHQHPSAVVSINRQLSVNIKYSKTLRFQISSGGPSVPPKLFSFCPAMNLMLRPKSMCLM